MNILKYRYKWDISVDSGKAEQIGSSSSQESFSGNDSRQMRLFKEELGSDLMDVGGAHEGGPGPGRQNVGL